MGWEGREYDREDGGGEEEGRRRRKKGKGVRKRGSRSIRVP